MKGFSALAFQQWKLEGRFSLQKEKKPRRKPGHSIPVFNEGLQGSNAEEEMKDTTLHWGLLWYKQKKDSNSFRQITREEYTETSVHKLVQESEEYMNKLYSRNTAGQSCDLLGSLGSRLQDSCQSSTVEKRSSPGSTCWDCSSGSSYMKKVVLSDSTLTPPTPPCCWLYNKGASAGIWI